MMAMNRIIKKKDTSYEIIWATLRIDPIWLYFELAAQPIRRIEYTEILDKIKNRRILCLLSYKDILSKEIIGTSRMLISKDKAGVK